jgi:hypothetical protein
VHDAPDVAENDIIVGGKRFEMFGKCGQGEFHGIREGELTAIDLNHPPIPVICGIGGGQKSIDRRQSLGNIGFSAIAAAVSRPTGGQTRYKLRQFLGGKLRFAFMKQL